MSSAVVGGAVYQIGQKQAEEREQSIEKVWFKELEKKTREGDGSIALEGRRAFICHCLSLQTHT